MTRAFLWATLVLAMGVIAAPTAASGQEVSVLHIKAALVDADGRTLPVPRHPLLISDEPPTAAPRRVLTAIDGTANVRLRPGAYTIESDEPVVFSGKAYTWTRHIVIAAGSDASLELTAANAEVDLNPSEPAATAPRDFDPVFLLPQWQNSILALWTPSTHASGFLIDSKGLIATNQRVVGDAATVEVQLSPEVKVAARVLEADAKRDVAVLWIDPSLVASVKPILLGCGEAAKPAAAGQALFAIGAPLRGPKRMTERSDTFEFRLPAGSAGGPVFTAAGSVIGLTSVGSNIVRLDAVCDIVASAEKKMAAAAPPSAARLPVEPSPPFPVDALKAAVQRRAGSVNPYPMPAADFDVTFITPVAVYAARSTPNAQRGRDFGNWTDYMAEIPPVLAIRATPKMVESFWTTMGRVAARTQGMDLPPFKHVKTGFARMQVFCGDAEVTPIHPFIVEQPISEREAVDEGLYVFDPAAIGPHCGAVKLVLYSEKEPAKADTRVVDPRVVEQIWKDFEPYRQ
jgi:hypothetical protein